MNTLPRAVTAQLFPDVSAYLALRRHWSALMNSERKHTLTAAHHLLYLALVGKDWRKAFTPITNPRKLDNGAYEGWELWRALQILHNEYMEAVVLAPFDGLVTPLMVRRLRGLISRAHTLTYHVEDFASGTFPFDAYQGPAILLAVSQSHSHV